MGEIVESRKTEPEKDRLSVQKSNKAKKAHTEKQTVNELCLSKLSVLDGFIDDDLPQNKHCHIPRDNIECKLSVSGAAKEKNDNNNNKFSRF